MVLTHDIAQRDNLRVGRHDGVAAVIEKLKGHPLFAHITLLRSERSPIAALVTEMLEEFPSDSVGVFASVCAPYGEANAWAPIADSLLRALDVDIAAPPDQIRALVRQGATERARPSRPS